MLPKKNYEILKYFSIGLFKISTYSEENEMTIPKLSNIFSINLLRMKDENIIQFQNTIKYIHKAIEFLITFSYSIFDYIILDKSISKKRFRRNNIEKNNRKEAEIDDDDDYDDNIENNNSNNNKEINNNNNKENKVVEEKKFLVKKKKKLI
jgi:hypothetical protein